MTTIIPRITLSMLLFAVAGSVLACEYKAGETSFIDYAKCRYGDEAILVVDLPKGSSWDHCVYHLQAFRPETLLAVTKVKNGKETASINDRGSIGNPCYLSKQQCDKALKAYEKEHPDY